MIDINDEFSYFIDGHRRKFQVLKHDENGVAYDWDEEASAEAMNNAPPPEKVGFIKKLFGG
jgi:hypothetical protein